MAMTLLDAGRLDEGETRFEEELSIREARAREAPADYEVQALLAHTLFMTGEIHMLTRQTAEGIAFFERDLAIARKLADHDPSNREWSRDLALSLHGSGDALVSRGDIDAGLRYLEQAEAILDRLLDGPSPHPGSNRDLRSIRCAIGRGRLKRGEALAALTSTRRGLGLLETALEDDLASDHQISGLARCLLTEGEAQLTMGQSRDAHNTWQQAHDLLRRHVTPESGPKVRDTWTRTLVRLGKTDEAGPWIDRLTKSGYRRPGFVAVCLRGETNDDAGEIGP